MNAIRLDLNIQQPGPRYFLSPHAFVCVSGPRAVLLDIKRDEYLGIDAIDGSVLALLVEDWPGVNTLHSAKQAADGASRPAIINELMGLGLLTTERPTTNGGNRIRLPKAKYDLSSDQSFEDRVLGFGTLGRMAEAVLRASLYLRILPLESVASRIRRRREKESASEDLKSKSLLAMASRRFCDLRPYFYRSQQACLFDSLCMLSFLNSCSLFPYWVFGVQVSPFSAHCWLQLDELVLNDTIDHVSLFSPIMIV